MCGVCTRARARSEVLTTLSIWLLPSPKGEELKFSISAPALRGRDGHGRPELLLLEIKRLSGRVVGEAPSSQGLERE